MHRRETLVKQYYAMRVYIVSDVPQLTESVNFYKSSILSEDTLMEKYKKFGYNDDLLFCPVNDDGTDMERCIRPILNIKEAINIMPTNWTWYHIKRTIRDSDDCTMFDRILPQKKEEDLYIKPFDLL